LTERLDERAEHLLRMYAPQVLGGVIRRYGDFAAAEDAVQEALVAAVAQWPRAGIPDRPGAWLMQVAMRRMTDYFRSEAARRQRESVAFETVAQEVDAEASEEKDDALILIFMSCHPALTTASAIALTLRAVGGLTTAEIARAFLVPESTMAQHISRAKQSIRSSGIRFRLPAPEELRSRLTAVLHVLYLIFNEGYTSSEGAESYSAAVEKRGLAKSKI
jgi:RNA polymerase sigma factor (sigma-70 family)